MCFTPKISMVTAVLEFAIASFIFLKYNKSTFAKFLAFFVFLLGFYQFTEYMLCTSGNIQLWGKMGFATYTFLPAVGMHFVLSYTKNSFNKFLIYLPVPIFILIAFANNNFITSGVCGDLFVSVENYFFNSSNKTLPTILYWLYYFSYIGIICGYLFRGIKREKNKTLILIYLIILATVLLTILPPLLLIIIFPALGYQFPSIYCQFALLFSIMALAGAYLDNRLRSRFKAKLYDLVHKIRL